MVRGHNRGLRQGARRADPLLRFDLRVDRVEDPLRVVENLVPDGLARFDRLA